MRDRSRPRADGPRRTPGPVTACVGLALLALAASCSGANDDAAPARATGGETGKTTGRAPQGRVAGDFQISNTTAGGDAAIVDTLVVRIESAPTDAGPWANAGASCTTTPRPPIQIETTQRIAYDCRVGARTPSEQRLRLVVRASIAGDDEVFRIVSNLPR